MRVAIITGLLLCGANAADAVSPDAVSAGAGPLIPAQVINGESTDDAGYARRPPARWAPPAPADERPDPAGSEPPTRGDDDRD